MKPDCALLHTSDEIPTPSSTPYQRQHRRSASAEVEQWLLRLLQVFVVSERQAFHCVTMRRCIPNNAPALAPHQLQQVRIFLLRHGAATGRIRFRQARRNPYSCAENRIISSAQRLRCIASIESALHELDRRNHDRWWHQCCSPLARQIQAAWPSIARSSGNVAPATAPEPNGQTFSRLRQSASRSASRKNISHIRQQPMPDQHRFRSLQMRVRRHRRVAGLLRHDR